MLERFSVLKLRRNCSRFAGDSIWAPRVQHVHEHRRGFHHWDVTDPVEDLERPVGPAPGKFPGRGHRDESIEASMDTEGRGFYFCPSRPDPGISYPQADRPARLEEGPAALASELVPFARLLDVGFDDIWWCAWGSGARG